MTLKLHTQRAVSGTAFHKTQPFKVKAVILLGAFDDIHKSEKGGFLTLKFADDQKLDSRRGLLGGMRGAGAEKKVDTRENEWFLALGGDRRKGGKSWGQSLSLSHRTFYRIVVERQYVEPLV